MSRFHQTGAEAFLDCVRVWESLVSNATDSVGSSSQERARVVTTMYGPGLATLLKFLLDRIQFRTNFEQLSDLDDEIRQDPTATPTTDGARSSQHCVDAVGIEVFGTFRIVCLAPPIPPAPLHVVAGLHCLRTRARPVCMTPNPAGCF